MWQGIVVIVRATMMQVHNAYGSDQGYAIEHQR
jgi:hypothetical protein